MTGRNPINLPRLSVVIILALITLVSIPLYADSFSFYLGPQPDPIPAVNGEAVGPYPGQLTDTTTHTIVSTDPFMCLDGNITTYWGSTLTGGTISSPLGEGEEEAAFLASQLLSKAQALGVTPDSYAHPNPPSPNTPAYSAFINSYAAPITFAIWQVMGTLPAGPLEPPGTQAFVNQAQAEYANVFSNPSSPLYAAGQVFLSSVIIFSPNPPGSNQRYMTAIDPSFVTSQPTPEPATLGLLAGSLLFLGCVRHTGKRNSN
ncbi:MAG: hypothetical protein P4L56_20180 [Candidatus Sulfopaludibacter sp.]|nr:hypothetical protein [Candidatus Sulfopaludibacter sp.]